MTVGRSTISDAEIAKILATMVEHLGKMTDPNYTKKLREDLLTIPDEVKTQNAKNQEFISQAESLKDQIKKQQDDANEQLKQREIAVASRESAMEELNARKKEAEAIEARNKEKEIALKKEADRLDGISKGHQETTAKHAEIKKGFDKTKNDLDIYKESLASKFLELQTYENSLNETAQQMQGLVKSKIRS